MTGGGKGEQDARMAAEIQTNLFRKYAALGMPPLKEALGYARGALAQGGLPGYVENAYQGARVGALEGAGQQLTGLRGQIAARGGAGGQFLQGITGAAGTAGDALSREMAGISTSRALAGVEQRNKLLGVLAGGAATATNLAAGFGRLGTQAISLNAGPDQTFGAVTGGVSALTGLYSALAQNRGLQANPWAPVFQGYGVPSGASYGLASGLTRPAL